MLNVDPLRLGQTALMYASMYGHPDVVTALMGAGANQRPRLAGA